MIIFFILLVPKGNMNFINGSISNIKVLKLKKMGIGQSQEYLQLSFFNATGS